MMVSGDFCAGSSRGYGIESILLLRCSRVSRCFLFAKELGGGEKILYSLINFILTHESFNKFLANVMQNTKISENSLDVRGKINVFSLMSKALTI